MNTRLGIRICGFLLLGIICSVYICGAFAEGISPRYSYINHITTGIIISGVTVEYSGTAGPISNYHRAKITVTLQERSVDGGSWSNVKSNVVYGNYSSQACYGGTYPADEDCEYRVYVHCTILDSNGVALETKSAYSQVERP